MYTSTTSTSSATYNETLGVWEQTWQLVELDLAVAQQRSLDSLAEHRYTLEIGGCQWTNGVDVVNVHTDRESQGKINAAFNMAVNGYWENGKTWKFKDGVFLPMTSAQVIDLVLTVANFVGGLYETEATLATTITAATTVQGCVWEWPS